MGEKYTGEHYGWTTKEAAAYLRVCPRTLRRWAKRSKIRGVKRGRVRLWLKSELDKMMKQFVQQVN